MAVDLVFVDLETTGGVASRDRITEIAIVRSRQGQEVRRWSSLVNPEQRLSPFIRKLTGLTDQMLAAAPLFAELAEAIRHELDDAIFVAHNAKFDYGFLKQEFSRAGINWQAQNLCTVKLSRTLYPEYPKHGLDQLIERHQLACLERHRAMGDAHATFLFYRHVCEQFGMARIESEIKKLILRPSLPPGLPADVLDGIPATAGIFEFYNAQGELLHLAATNNLFQKITSSFQSHKGPEWYQQITRLDYKECAGEFSAQLLANQRAQLTTPTCQRNKSECYCTISLVANKQGALQPQFSDTLNPVEIEHYYGLFQSRQQAKKAVRGLEQAYQLELETEGQDDVVRHNAKVQAAFSGLKLQAWPWSSAILIEESELFTGIRMYHLFNHWCYLGSFEREPQAFELQALSSSTQERSFNRALYLLLQKQLMAKNSALKVVPVEMDEDVTQ